MLHFNQIEILVVRFAKHTSSETLLYIVLRTKVGREQDILPDMVVFVHSCGSSGLVIARDIEFFRCFIA